MLRYPGFSAVSGGVDIHQSTQTCCFFVSKTCLRASMTVVVEGVVVVTRSVSGVG